MAASGFEWFVAWRHLREEPSRRSPRTMIVGLVLLAVGGAWLLLARFGPGAIDRLLHIGPWLEMRVEGTPYIDWLKGVAVGAIALGLLLAILGGLFASFTVFTAISIFGVFLGTGAPIIALSVMSGFEADLKSKIRATKADVVIDRADDQPFTDWRQIKEKIADVPGVVASMAYIESEVIVKHISNPAGMGIILRGVEVARAARVLDLPRTLKEGGIDYLAHPESIPSDFLTTRLAPPLDDAGGGPPDKASRKGKNEGEGAGPEPLEDPSPSPPPSAPRRELPGILLGEELFAHTLRVYMGSEVDVACPMCGVGPTGPMPRLRSFRVAGHFYTGMYEFDSKLAYVSLEEAQRFLGMKGEVTGIEVRTVDADAANEVAERIAARLGPGLEARSWQELNRNLFAALWVEKLGMFIFLTFIALVASFSIVSNLIMLVTEKGREVAILKSMGATDPGILRVFFAEGLYIGLVGLGLGLLMGLGSCLLIWRFGLPLDPDVYYIQKLPIVVRPSEIASVAAAALGLCCLATLYPAYLASRMRPVEGLRYE
jgi:lipoprotein-releasing system permease protein